MAGSSMEASFGTGGAIRQLVDAVRDAMIVVDQAGSIVLANTQVERLFGYQRRELTGRPIEVLIPEPFRERHPNYRAEFIKSPRQRQMGAGMEILALRKDGNRFPAEIDLCPLEIEGSTFVSCVVREVTEEKSAAGLRGRLQEQEALLGEVHHRVKNNLQVVSSLLNLQANQLGDPIAREMFEATQSRIRSMALVHEQLYKSGNFSAIDFQTYLRVLAADLLNSYRSDTDSVNVRVTADRVRLNLETAIPCGMIVNELVANSLKHAFPERSEGEIRIGFRAGAGEYTLTVDDDGVPLPPDILTREFRSMGMRLVKLLARQLDAQLRTGGAGEPKFILVFRRGTGQT
ncbi:MAG TPA: histidine kinase dimerization/phosphoacceptor domain -containing protein [Bryobacteraceae bacterium]|jgi:PAS domain S-box-containing protein